MGRSAFAYGTLVKLVARADMQWLDVDGVRAHVQLRVMHLPLDVYSKLLVAHEYVSNPEDTIKRLIENTVHTEDEMKTRLTALSNLEAQDWADFPLEARQWAASFVDDMKTIINFEKQRHPELRTHFDEYEHPDLSFIACLDHHREALQIDKIDTRFGSNEFDGVAFYVPGSLNVQDTYEQKTKRCAPFRMKLKAYPSVLAHAQKKFPMLDWTTVTSVPAAEWVHAYTRVLAARSAKDIRAIDSCVTTVMRGRVTSVVSKSGEKWTFLTTASGSKT